MQNVAPEPDRMLDHAIADHQAGRLAEAEAAYLRLLQRQPQQPDALHLLGLLACDRDQPAAALRQVEAALAREPGRAAFHNTRARALAMLHRPADAREAYLAAWRLRPGSAEIANNLGCLLRGNGAVGEAVEWFRRAAALAPGSADIAVNLALALQETGALGAALAQMQQALVLRPGCAEIGYQLGHLHLACGQPEAAEHCLRAALRRRPDHAATANNLGIALDRQGCGDAAAQCFRDALRCDPNDADAHYNLGCMLLLDNRGAEARAHHDRALAIDPLHGRARWARCMAELPLIHDSAAGIGPARAAYAAELAELAAANGAERAALAAAIGCSQPFLLPYQGQCDRELQAAYGALLTSLVPGDPGIMPAAPPAPGERVRLGFVSGHVCEHTVWRLMLRGWLGSIDRSRFCLHLYDAGMAPDGQTALAQQLVDRYQRGDAAGLRAAILADRPHVLIYPELGMDPVCARLAVERLAPVQCVGWGQPQTSGLPSIDWFLSSAAMEPPHAALHYTERLVRLPHLGVRPVLQDDPPVPGERGAARAHFGLRPAATVFWCGQMIAKYLPQHDVVFTRLARAVPDSQFLFIGFARSRVATAHLRGRLARAFADAGLVAERHLVFAEPMDQSHFRASVMASDIVLDSIGWSGGKSTLDMLQDAPVIVTHEGTLLRARHTAGILRCLGVTETIAGSVDEFIAIALRLALDPAERAGLASRLASGRVWLLDDVSPIRALEAFLVRQLQAIRTSGTPAAG